MSELNNTSNLLVEPIVNHSAEIIKVIGVGGGGGNAVGQMYREGIEGVRFLVCNTDQKALEDSVVPDKIQLGPGLGAGGQPVVGQDLAEKSLDKIDAIFDDKVKMVFITAGMGGGTGTGASPVIAREARAHGVLTVGIVTIPFLFERERQIDKALDGLERLGKEVDAMLVINNQRLCDIYTDLTIIDAFKKADLTLTTAVRCIVEIIEMHGRVGLDFCDVSNVLRNGGVAIMSTGFGKGEKRVTKAIEEALYSPLINNNNVYRAHKIILAITINPDPKYALRMEEVGEVNEFMAKFSDNIETKWGLVTDENMGEQVKITILASGFNLNGQTVDDEYTQRHAAIRARYYDDGGPMRKRVRHKRQVFLFDTADLGNERLAEAVSASPTDTRTSGTLESFSHLKQQSLGDGACDDAENAVGQPTGFSANGAARAEEGSVVIDFSN